MWISGDYSAIQSIQIQTREPPPDSFSLPFDTSAALLGSVIGLVVVMVVLALWRVISEKTPTTESDGTFQIRRESRIERRLEIQKREVPCPSCNQKLSVPASHVGAVKCPSCTTQFRVGEEEAGDIENNLGDNANSDPYEESSQPEKSTEIQNSRSSGEILSCPSCEQRLKVPIEKRPVMSRCPACRAEFMALNEGDPQ
jgi:Zn finger protein HypA/HybF involved in hydrogenase expression